MMKVLKSMVAGACLLAAGNSCANTSYICSGKVDNFEVAAAGIVQIMSTEIYSGSAAGRTLCNVNSPWKGVSTESCKTWVSMIMLAQTTKSALRINYVDALDCANQPTWGNANAPFLVGRQ